MGFKHQQKMNETFLMKMFWDLTTSAHDLWCKVLHSKYGKEQ